MTSRPEADIHVLDRLAVFYRHRILAVAVFVSSAAVIGLSGPAPTTPLYQAQARIMIDDERAAALPGFSAAESRHYVNQAPYLDSQYRIIQGPELARRVVRKLNVDTLLPDAGGAPSPAPDAAPGQSEEALVGMLTSLVGVSPVADTRLVDVTFLSTDPALAARAVNTLVDEYVDLNLENRNRSSGKSLEVIDGELAKLQQKVEEAERALVDYRLKQDALSLDQRQDIVSERLNQLNALAVGARTARVEKEAQHAQINGQGAAASLESIPAIARNGQVQAAKASLLEIQADHLKLQERYGERHPEVVRARAGVDEARRRFDRELATAAHGITAEYETAVLQERAFAASLEAAARDAASLGRHSAAYGILEREADSYRQLYETLLHSANELRVVARSRTNNVRVVERADPPAQPLPPPRGRWPLALGIGLALAVGAVLARDYLSDTIKTPDDVARLKAPFLGLVPSVGKGVEPLLTSADLPEAFAEALRALRTALINACPGDSAGPRVVVVTSAVPLDGKTTTAANLALALAGAGRRVLIVDADLRRPGLHRVLGLTGEPGLTEVLTGQTRLREILQRTADANLLAVAAGRVPSNPSELLSSVRMTALLANLRHSPFEWIVIDTPPVLGATDAEILAPGASAVVLIVRAEATARRFAVRALDAIAASPQPSVSIVLNQVDLARNRYYYQRHFGHRDASYYASET